MYPYEGSKYLLCCWTCCAPIQEPRYQLVHRIVDIFTYNNERCVPDEESTDTGRFGNTTDE